MTTQELRLACLERGRGRCECGGESFDGCDRPAQELDHFFGRAKAEESLETCWILSTVCHEAKTLNRGGAGHWLRKFMAHCNRRSIKSGNLEELQRWLVVYKQAAEKYAWAETKAGFRR